MREPRRNLAQSVHHRLLSKAKEQGEDFDLVLIRYALERFLYRLGRSQHKDRLILKGPCYSPPGPTGLIGRPVTSIYSASAIPRTRHCGRSLARLSARPSSRTAWSSMKGASAFQRSERHRTIRANGSSFPADLSSVIRDLRGFLLAPLQAASRTVTFPQSWNPGGPWA